MTFGNYKVEIRRGPAPDSAKGQLGVAGAAAIARRLAAAKEEEKMQSSLRAAEEAAARAGKDTAAYKQAQSVVAKINAQMRANKLALQAQTAALDVKSTNADSTDFHAIIPINDYPQKARWRVTNKETMVQVRLAVRHIWTRMLTYNAHLRPLAHRYHRCISHQQRYVVPEPGQVPFANILLHRYLLRVK